MKTADEFLRSLGPVATPHARAARWPLVHRTNLAALNQIAADGQLALKPAGSEPERDAGRGEVVYFFAGAGVYPHGLVAFLVDPELTRSLPCTLTPYDTGGVQGGRMTHDGTQHQLYADWCTDGAALGDALPAYVAAGFDDGDDYVRRTHGPPDRWVHSVRPTDEGFAGAWTIEVQVHEAVPVARWVNRTVVAKSDLLRLLPDLFLRDAQLVDDRVPSDVTEEQFATGLVPWILSFA